MASRGAYGEKYAARHRRELERDVEEGTFVGWATEEEIAARRADMDRSIRKEVQAGQPRQHEESRPSNSTFVGSINPQRAFSHNVQGVTPPVPDLRFFPAGAEALRTTNEFCDQYRILRDEVEILQDENNRLRRMLERFLTPIAVVPPSPPRDQA